MSTPAIHLVAALCAGFVIADSAGRLLAREGSLLDGLTLLVAGVAIGLSVAAQIVGVGP